MKKQLIFFLVFIVWLFFLTPAFPSGNIIPEDLTTEWMKNPMGVEVMQPGLSWKLTAEERGQRQSGYQILVASSKQMLETDSGDVWNSGCIKSDKQTNILYSGPELQDGKRYYWKVKAGLV